MSRDRQVPARADLGRAAGPPTRVGAVVTGALACFGLVISSALVAVVTAGALQWVNLPGWLDNGIPVVVLLGGLALAGRVATDVAGRWGPWCGLGAAALVAAIGAALARAGEAHGDGVEPVQVVVGFVVVAALTCSTAWWVAHRRTTERRPAQEPDAG
ncbi:hypothetical protein GCM10027596_04370 [Nocardioides korecus]